MEKDLMTVSKKLYKPGMNILKAILNYDRTCNKLESELEQLKELSQIKEQDLELEKKEIIANHNKRMKMLERNRLINESTFDDISLSLKEFDEFHKQIMALFDKVFQEINKTTDLQKRQALKSIREKYFSKLIDEYLHINQLVNEMF